MELRNCVLVALAFNATPAEVEAAHEIIDRISGNNAGVDPSYLVSANVPGQQAAAQAALPGIEGAATIGSTPDAAAAAGDGQGVDKDGLPWDARIHSSSKAKNADGSWRVKRGLTDTLKAQVEAELKSSTAANTAAATTAAVTPPAAGVGGLPPLPGGNLPPLPNAAATDPAYTALVQLIATNTRSDANPNGRITDDWVKTILSHYGVAEGNLQNLAHTPALVPQIATYIAAALAAA